MWQLFVFLIGFVFCSDRETDVETIAGKDVDLKCLGNNTNPHRVTITWTRSNNMTFLKCSSRTPVCGKNNTRHTFGRNNTFISSTVTIRNVSLVHADEYDISIVSSTYIQTCKINLTVNVPPKGLILIENTDDTIFQNQGSLTVAEGENKTLVCKTDTPVTQFVHLEWDFKTKELNASVEPQKDTYDGHDVRLLVPTRTIHFTPTYGDDEDIVLTCKVASNSSFDYIQTSVRIINEGERTTNSKTTGTGSEESHAITTSNGHSQESDYPAWYEKMYLVIPGCFGLVMLFIVLAFVGGFIRSKRRDVRRSINVESTEIRPLQGRRSLPPTPSDHLPDQPPPTARLIRPVPSIPSDIPMRPLVPVSEDAFRSPAERTCSRMTGQTFTTAAGSTALTQAQQELHTEMEYDLLNISHHGAPGAVPHVYRETANGSQIDDDSDYDLLNTLNQTGHGTVPHVYKETTSGLAEYAVVSKPEDKKKRQSLGPLTKVMKAPIDMEAEYAVVDKSKKRAK